MPGWRQIKNRKSAMSEPYAAIGVETLPIRAPMLYGIRHSSQVYGRDRLTVYIENAADPAHSLPFPAILHPKSLS